MTTATATSVAGARAAAPVRPPLLGLIAVGLVVCLSLAYGFSYRFAQDPVAYFHAWGLVFAGLAAVGAAVALLPAANRSIAVPDGGLGWLGCLATWFAFALTCWFYEDALGPLPAPAAIGAALVAAGALQSWRGGGAGARLIAALAFALFAWLVASRPIDVQAANMLPLVAAGSADFLRGLNPYLQSYPEIAAILPFHYLPGLWLPYAGAVALDMEMRLVSLACLVVLIAIFEGLAGRRSAPHLLGLAIYPLLASPVVAQMIIHGHVWPYWVLTAAVVALLGSRRFLAAAVAIGLLLTARQLAVFLVAPIAVYMIRQLGPARALGYGALALAVYLAVMLPFVLWTPDFFGELYLSVAGEGEVHAEIGNPLDQVALSGWFYTAGIDGWLIVVQAVLMLGALAYAFADKRLDMPRFLAFAGLVYVLAVALNPFVYRYHYVPGLLTLAAAVLFAWPAATRRPASRGA
jgi:hypothetical protein